MSSNPPRPSSAGGTKVGSMARGRRERTVRRPAKSPKLIEKVRENLKEKIINQLKVFLRRRMSLRFYFLKNSELVKLLITRSAKR